MMLNVKKFCRVFDFIVSVAKSIPFSNFGGLYQIQGQNSTKISVILPALYSTRTQPCWLNWQNGETDLSSGQETLFQMWPLNESLGVNMPQPKNTAWLHCLETFLARVREIHFFLKLILLTHALWYLNVTHGVRRWANTQTHAFTQVQIHTPWNYDSY